MDARVKREITHKGTCYVLDHSKIKEGDVLLTTSDAWVSSIIKKVTGSAFSHAAIFTQDDGIIIEAVPPNVKLSSVLGMAIRERKNIKVLRWAGSGAACDTHSIVTSANSHVFKDYSRKGAVLSKTPGSFGGEEENGLFCSQLIASSYLSCGLLLTNKAPEKTTPADIANSEKMIDITDDVLVEVDTRHLLVERFVEQGSEGDLSAKFHSVIKNIVDTTVRACPFVKKLSLKSLEEVMVVLVHGDKFFTPDQMSLLQTQFTLAVGDKLDRLIEQLLAGHSESFVQHEIIRLIIRNSWATDDQLRNHLKLLETLSAQTQQSLDKREKNIKEAVSMFAEAPSTIANLPVIKAIERFYNDLLTTEQKMFDMSIPAMAELRSYLDHSSA